MIDFQRHSDCSLCDLYESATNPGIPTRPLLDDQQVTKKKAILFLGQNPGNNEDQSTKANPHGKCFIGYTGQLLEKFVAATGLSQYCDIYLSNACRCKHPQGGDITQKHVRACRNYLYQDLFALFEHYEEVIVFAIGAKAVYSILNKSSLNEAFKQQGHAVEFQLSAEETKTIRVFSTFHLAILHPMRQPAKVTAVQAHFALVKRYLEGKFTPNDLVKPPQVGIPVPKYLSEVVTMDIETYGILRGVEQTVFNPIKSLHIDGIPAENQVVCINFAWRDQKGEIQSAEYVFSDPKHRALIRHWFEVISKKKIIMTGQNIKFDLMYLWYADHILRYWIDPRRLIIDDTLILIFLLYEQYPEKGLKEASLLFGVADYSKMKVTGKDGNAKSPWDKDLHLYNSVDSVTTLKMREWLLDTIAERYGTDSPKLSEACFKMRQIVVWDTFDLDLNGSTLNIKKLQAFHEKELTRCERLKFISEHKYEMKLCGKFSDRPLRDFFVECVKEADLLSDSRVEYTAKTKRISIGVENANLLKKYLPPGRSLDIVSKFQQYKERSKIVNTYTKPLLTVPRKGIVTRMGNRGMVYPSWYPIPSYFERGGSSDDKVGGQTQGRFSCKKPARQTEPYSIRDCSCSRWVGGKLAEYDVNQDHLRMAALLSGDPVLMEAYKVPGQSIHTRTALTIFPNADPTSPGWKKTDRYKLGKTLNFLVIFKGGPAAFQSTALSDAGVEVNIDFCDQAIKTWYNKHYVYKQWQDGLIDQAAAQGYLILPTGWSRTFGIGPSGVANYTGEICNFMHQTPCAQVIQGIQYEVMNMLRKNYMRTLLCLQIYDAIFTDIYPGEEKAVDQIVAEAFAHPKVLEIFMEWVGREISWQYEKKSYES